MSIGFHAVVRRVVWNILPVSLVLGAVGVFFAGEDGFIERAQIKQHLYATQANVAEAQRENEVLRSRIRLLRNDRRFVIRAAAERLLMAEEGSTIYRFDGPIR
jgi:cell division protein FtsB